MSADTATRPKSVKHSIETKEAAFRLFAGGMRLVDIAPQLNIKIHTLGDWSQKGKWQSRKVLEASKAGFVPKGSRDDPNADNRVPIPEGMTLAQSQAFYEEQMRRDALEFVAELANMPQSLKLAAADKIEKRDKIARKALKLETDKPPMAINIKLLAQGRVELVASASAVPADEALPLVEESGLIPALPAPDASVES